MSSKPYFCGRGRFNSNVTVAIPSYNRPDLIKLAIESVINQSVFPKLIIVDNYSDSANFNELLLLANKYEEYDISIYRNEENLGMFGNFNRCLELCSTEWITFLCDDDTLNNNCIREFLRLDKTQNYDLVRFASVSSKASIMRKFIIKLPHVFKYKKIIKISDNVLSNKYSGVLGVFYKVEKLRTIGGFDASRYPSSDYYAAILFSAYYKFLLYGRIAGIYNVGDNASLKIETLNYFIVQDCRIIIEFMSKIGLSSSIISRYLGDLVARRTDQYLKSWNNKFNLSATTTKFLQKHNIFVLNNPIIRFYVWIRIRLIS
jgi:glycosyltransferase involved in cell wall biosynthesis